MINETFVIKVIVYIKTKGKNLSYTNINLFLFSSPPGDALLITFYLWNVLFFL